jgi:hypothetical protein
VIGDEPVSVILLSESMLAVGPGGAEAHHRPGGEGQYYHVYDVTACEKSLLRSNGALRRSFSRVV